jgi:pimeloyl-ACP methyl ester carboxylesterase
MIDVQQRRVHAGGYDALVLEAGPAAPLNAPPTAGPPTAGPAIVLLASMFVRARTYRPLLEVLARDFRTLVVEAPGTGEASRVESPWDFERYAQWLDEFLAAQDLSDVTLIGHSNSGPPVFLAGVRHDARVGRVVLADSTGVDARHSFLRVALGRLADVPFEPVFSARVAPDIIYSLVTHRRHVIHQIKQAYEFDMTGLADQIRVPLLLAWGRWDWTYPRRYARRFHALSPRSRLHVNPRGSHDWLVARREDFAAVVADFVRDTTARPATSALSAPPAVV